MATATSDTPVLDLLADMTASSVDASSLDSQSLVLVRLAALAAVDAPTASYLLNLGAANRVGLDVESVRGVLTAIAPIVGTARVVSASARIVDALDVALEIAEEEAEIEAEELERQQQDEPVLARSHRTRRAVGIPRQQAMTAAPTPATVHDMSRLVDFYATQVRILWNWRGGPWALFKRLVITLLVSTIALLVTAGILPGITVGRPARRGRRGHHHGDLQRRDPTGPADARRADLADPAGDPRPHRPGRDVPVHRAAGRWRGRRRVLRRAHRIVHLRRREHGPDLAPRGRSRRVVLRPAGLEHDGQARPGREVGQAGSGHHPDRRAGPSDPRRARPRRVGQHARQLDPRQEPQAVALGGDPAVDDLGQPGRHPARHQRRHPGLPLVRARPAEADGLEQPRRRRGDRPPPVERRGPAVEQRREHLQPDDRRRDARLRHDRRDQGRFAGSRRQSGVPRLLLQPERLPAFVLDVPRRVRQGALPGAADPALRHHAADAPRHEVRRDAGRQQRPAARHEHVADHRGDVSRRERHLLRLHRLRRARPSLRPGADRVVPGARRGRRGDRHAGQGGRGRAPTVQVRHPVRPRPEPRRDLQAALRPEPRRGRARPDERSSQPVPAADRGRGLDLRQLVPVGDHPEPGHRPGRRPRRARQPDHGRDRRPRQGRRPAARRRVVDRRRRVRQPGARLVHRLRPPADGRGARDHAPEPHRRPWRRIPASA